MSPEQPWPAPPEPAGFQGQAALELNLTPKKGQCTPLRLYPSPAHEFVSQAAQRINELPLSRTHLPGLSLVPLRDATPASEPTLEGFEAPCDGRAPKGDPGDALQPRPNGSTVQSLACTDCSRGCRLGNEQTDSSSSRFSRLGRARAQPLPKKGQCTPLRLYPSPAHEFVSPAAQRINELPLSRTHLPGLSLVPLRDAHPRKRATLEGFEAPCDGRSPKGDPGDALQPRPNGSTVQSLACSDCSRGCRLGNEQTDSSSSRFSRSGRVRAQPRR